VFLLTPALNAGGYNGFHWLNMLNASTSRTPLFYVGYARELDLVHEPNCSEIYCLPLFVERLLDAPIPNALLRLPLVLIVAVSSLPLFLTERSQRLHALLATIMLCLLSHFLCYWVVWEYQYATLMPLLPVLWWMTQREERAGPRWALRIAFVVLLVNFLPTFYWLDPQRFLRFVTANNLVRVVPVIIAFVCLLFYTIDNFWRAMREKTVGIQPGQLPELLGIGGILALSGAAVLASVFYSVPERFTKSVKEWTSDDWLIHCEDLHQRPMRGLAGKDLTFIALVLFSHGEVAEALPHLERAVELEPENVQSQYRLAVALHRLGRSGVAVEHLRAAVKLQPDDLWSVYQLAWILATSPDDSVRDGARGMELAQRAIELSASREPRAFDALAAAQAESGQFPAAVTTAERAANMARAAGDGPLAAAIEQRTKLYRQGACYRESPAAGSSDPAPPAAAE
jgi:Tetratricopeptide repeat